MRIRRLTAWRILGFPALDEMILKHSDTLESIITWGALDVLQVTARCTSGSRIVYALNSIDRFSLVGDTELLSGIAFEMTVAD